MEAAPTLAQSTSGIRSRTGDQYELLGEIAAGGMGTVFLARLRRPMGFARLVAVKSMHRHYANDPEFASMFLDEARLAARLHHPNIVSTLDVVADDDQVLIVMEYVDGASLGNLLALTRSVGGRIPVEIACALVHDTLLGLHEAHELKDEEGTDLGVVHRDVSPHNVIVGLDGLARVLDFGVAKARSQLHATEGGVVKGKLRYMPPEQVLAHPVDRRADVYAAGALLWELLCGRPLFEGRADVVTARILEGVVPPPSTRADGITAALDAVVLRALSSAADRRYASAREMAQAIAKHVVLPHRTEIGTWMRKWVEPREVPSGRAKAAGGDLSGPNADTIVAALERGTQERHQSGDGFALATEADLRPPRGPVVTAARRHGPLVLGMGALVLATLALAGARRSATAQPMTIASSPQAPPANVPALAPVPAEESVQPALVIAPAPPVAAAPSAHAPRAAATRRTSTTDDAAPCRPPYYLDANGKRHFKVECL